jgi:uncharacterized repeat protein (TIGR01451 family)
MALVLATIVIASPDRTAPASAATTGCIDWRDYSATNAPPGSDDLGAEGGNNNVAGGTSKTLTGVLDEDVDLRITWVYDHVGVILDPGTTADFTGLDSYLSVLGGTSTTSVLRYWPNTGSQHGQMHFEFFEAGTTNRVDVDVNQLLTGGNRKFNGRPWGVSEIALKSGGPTGTAVPSSFADPDVSGSDADGGGNGIAGLGSTPIIELDLPNFGSAISSAYNETRDSYVGVGSLATRDWSVYDWGGVTADTIVWDLYGTAPNDDVSPQPDPETTDPANFIPHNGLSAYISGLCITASSAPEYDLALAKTLEDYDPATREATYEVTVRNQGEVTSGEFTVTDELPSGMSFVSADAGATESGGVVTWTVPAANELDPDGTVTLSFVAEVDDVNAGPFTNTAEITTDSGDDDDSTIDGDLGNDALVDITDPADLATDTDVDTPDEDDHDIAVLELGYSLGNQVWLDEDNDGSIDADEDGIEKVWVELFSDDDDDGLPDDRTGDGKITTADAIAETSTDIDGLYLFGGLQAGTYVVGIPPMEWDSDGPLVGTVSSDPTEADPDTDEDGDDNGANGSDGYVFSGSVMIGDGEPLGEDPDNDGVTADADENLTVDFGFNAPVFDLALRKKLAADTPTDLSVGDEVTFEIEVFNQGDVDAKDATVVDYVPAGLRLADDDWTETAAGATTQTGAIAAGDSVTVEITFEIAAGASGRIENLAEIAGATSAVTMPNGDPLPDIDSIPDDDPDDDLIDDQIDGSGDEDDHDVAVLSLATQPSTPSAPTTPAAPVTSATPTTPASTNLASTGSWSDQMAIFALALVLIGISLTGHAALRRTR